MTRIGGDTLGSRCSYAQQGKDRKGLFGLMKFWLLLLLLLVRGRHGSPRFRTHRRLIPIGQITKGTQSLFTKGRSQSLFCRGQSLFRPSTPRLVCRCWCLLVCSRSFGIGHGIIELLLLLLLLVLLFQLSLLIKIPASIIGGVMNVVVVVGACHTTARNTSTTATHEIKAAIIVKVSSARASTTDGSRASKETIQHHGSFLTGIQFFIGFLSNNGGKG